jgi:uncharacterized membrane protein
MNSTFSPSRRQKTAIAALVVAVVGYLLLIGIFALPVLLSLRGLLIVLTFYLAYRLVRAIERIAIATEQLAEK